MGYTFTCLFGRVSGESRQTAAWPSLPSVGRDLAGGCAREKKADGDTVSTAQFHHGPTTGWTVKSAGRGRQAGPVSWVTWSAAAAAEWSETRWWRRGGVSYPGPVRVGSPVQ